MMAHMYLLIQPSQVLWAIRCELSGVGHGCALYLAADQMCLVDRYVEELDLLALALKGTFKERPMQLQCKGAAA